MESTQAVSYAFTILQVILGVAGVLFILSLLSRKQNDSNFKKREADREDLKRILLQGDRLEDAKFEQKTPKLLTGIRLDQSPHDILGIPENASIEQIHQAYRELMKRYHPDKIASQDTPQWKEAQKIAESINQARDELLKIRGK